MEELSLDNILNEDQINDLFGSGPSEDTHDEEEQEETTENNETKEEFTATEASLETLFGDEPESVGSEENTGEKDATSSRSNVSSNFYSSIANALVEDGILQNLEKEDLDKIKTAEDFADTISSYISNQLDERQKRVDEALNAGVEPTEIQKYERYLNTLDNISEDQLSSEDDEGENLRKNIMYQDYINKGYSKEKAMKMVERSINSGTDIEDAKEALHDNIEYFKKQYESVRQNARKQVEEQKKKIQKQAEDLKNSILKEEKAFGEISLDKNTRQRVYDSICKPVYKDPETGTQLTAIQKYEMENRTDFLKNVGLLYVLTDGFKNINKLVNDKVKKETKKNLRNLEKTLHTNSSGFNTGNLSFANNSGDTDPESLFKGWKLSI